MIRHLGLVLLALLGCTASSEASAIDNRIRTLRYDPNQIVTVPGKSSIQSTIEFGSDEHIESVAVGNSAAWQVTPNHRASLLFVKPLVGWSRTNMTVVTDKRTYMFDLVTSRYGPAPIYSLKFSYPETLVEKAKLEQAKLEQASAVAPTLAAAPPSPVQLNFGWKTKGTPALLPARVFDDGTTLYLAWARNVILPALSTLAEDGKEASLNYRVAGDYIVVTPVPDNVQLRYGKKTSTAYRVAPDRSVRGTSGVVRQADETVYPSLPAQSAAPTVTPSREPAIAGPQVTAATTPPEQHAEIFHKLAYAFPEDDHVTDNHHE